MVTPPFHGNNETGPVGPPTFLSFLVNVEIQREEVFGKHFLIWQTLQQKHQLFLTQSLQPGGAETPALSTGTCWPKSTRRCKHLFRLFIW